MKNLLNLGCGKNYHEDWINLDFGNLDNKSGEDKIISHDLLKGIPFENNSIDVIYCSHVLEHFSKTDASNFLQECYRVLNFAGIIRIVVPNLEEIAKLYLDCLEKSISGDEEYQQNYDWMLLELYDQTVRNKNGGIMSDYLSKEHLSNKKFIIDRIGLDGEKTISYYQKIKKQTHHSASISIRDFLKPTFIREKIIKLLLGKEYKYLLDGRFRSSGEIHKWMYDKYSLEKVLKNNGFDSFTVLNATESKIENWQSYELDATSNGLIRKPDSIFVEAIKKNEHSS